MSSAYLSYQANDERSRLLLQSKVLEPLGERALAKVGVAEGAQVADIGCGALGLLRALSRRVGPTGRVVGTDVGAAMVEGARTTCVEERLQNVEVVQDDLFASKLPAGQFDLVHGRFLLAPLGRDAEIAAALERLVKPGGVVLLEESEASSWQIFGDAHGTHRRLVEVIERAFQTRLGGFNSGRRLLPLARARGWRDVELDAQVVGIPPGHPYLRAPVLFATALRPILLEVIAAEELDALVAEAEALYARPETHGVSFTVVQVWGRPV